MTMQQVFQSFIDFCAEPAPADPQDAHVIAFHLDPLVGPTDVHPYNGTAVIRRLQPGLNRFFLEGFGIRNTVIGHPTPADPSDVVRIGFQIHRPNPIEGILEFGGMNAFGGLDPDHIDRSESCDVTAEQIGNDIGLLIVSDAGRRGAMLRKTNVLHSKPLP